MSLVREDRRGLFIRCNMMRFRPGRVRDCDPAYRMDDGGLVAGRSVIARHIPGTRLASVRVMNVDGTETRLHWAEESEPRMRESKRSKD